MTRFRKALAAGALCAAGIVGAAQAAGLFGNLPFAGGAQYPTTLPLTGAESAPFDTQLTQGLNPATELISVNQLISAIGGANISGNLLVGGDATSNLFQRATSGSSVTTTLTYGGPDQWAYWSGTGTAMTVSQDTTAADLSAGFPVAFKMARTSGQTGVVQMCMAQEIETNLVKASGIAGSTAELTFSAITGANFSASLANMTAFIVTGTGTDQGLAGSASMAFTLNAGGGGSGGWTSQANATAAVISLGGVSTAGRYGAVASIPANVTEIGVALCWTPVGTAGTNDYVAFSGIQLKKSPNQAGLVSASLGYNCVTSGIQCSNFERRAFPIEQGLQFRYYLQVNDNVANTVPITLCQATTTSAVVCVHQFPVAMRAAPTATASASTAFGDTATAGAPTACTAFAVVASSTSIFSGKTTCTTGATTTAGGASQLVGANTGANVNFSASL